MTTIEHRFRPPCKDGNEFASRIAEANIDGIPEDRLIHVLKAYVAEARAIARPRTVEEDVIERAIAFIEANKTRQVWDSTDLRIAVDRLLAARKDGK